jgi:hypothetical protein
MLRAKVAMTLVMLGVGATGLGQTRGVRAAVKEVEPAGPVVVIDTSMGRITCRLYEKQAPVMSANIVALAEGSKDWERPGYGSDGAWQGVL